MMKIIILKRKLFLMKNHQVLLLFYHKDISKVVEIIHLGVLIWPVRQDNQVHQELVEVVEVVERLELMGHPEQVE